MLYASKCTIHSSAHSLEPSTPHIRRPFRRPTGNSIYPSLRLDRGTQPSKTQKKQQNLKHARTGVGQVGRIRFGRQNMCFGRGNTFLGRTRFGLETKKVLGHSKTRLPFPHKSPEEDKPWLPQSGSTPQITVCNVAFMVIDRENANLVT